MNEYIIKFKEWYEQRNTRERLFALAFSLAIIYGLFSLILFRPVEHESESLRADIKKYQNDIANWNSQLDALDKLAKSPMYHEWVKQTQSFKNLRGQYKDLIESSTSNRWQEVIKALLQSQSNIKLINLKNLPETLYTQAGQTTSLKIYQQQFSVGIYGSNYFDVLNYVQKLEQTFPNVYWNKLDYEVMQYPLAKVEMEFSILYEKPN